MGISEWKLHAGRFWLKIKERTLKKNLKVSNNDHAACSGGVCSVGD